MSDPIVERLVVRDSFCHSLIRLFARRPRLPTHLDAMKASTLRQGFPSQISFSGTCPQALVAEFIHPPLPSAKQQEHK
eukprot:3634455-Amphidinium_carterae.1